MTDQIEPESTNLPPEAQKPIPLRPPEVGDLIHPFTQLAPNSYLTYGLLIIICAIFVVQYAIQASGPEIFDVIWARCYSGSKIVHDFAGCGPAMIEGGEMWRLFTMMFLHADPTHIAFNAIALYVLGRDMERVYGPVRFLFLYIFGGLAGSLLSFGINGMDEFSVGASGAIFAIAGVNLAFFYAYKDKLGQFGQERFQSMIRVVGINLLIGLLLIRVNNAAHIGGLLGGILLGYMFIPWYTVVETIPKIQIQDANSLSKKSFQALLVVGGTAVLSYALWYFWRLMTVPF